MFGRGIHPVRQTAIYHQDTVTSRRGMQPDQRPIDPVNAISRIADVFWEKGARDNAGGVEGYPAFFYGYILPVEIGQAGYGRMRTAIVSGAIWQ